MKLRNLSLAVLGAAAVSLPLSAQITLVSGTPGANEVGPVGGVFIYSQDFDALPTDTTTWTDNVSLPGWYANRTTYSNTSGGGSGTGAMYNYGTTSSASDRSLGAQPNTSNPVIFGVRLVNATGSTLTDFDASYIVEQWRRDTAPNSTVTFAYQIFDAGVGSLTDGSWTTLQVTTPSVTGTGGAISGNNPENQTVVNVSADNIAWGDGQELWIRWSLEKINGSNIHIAVEDFTLTVTAVPEPATTASVLGVAGLAALLWRRRRA